MNKILLGITGTLLVVAAFLSPFIIGGLFALIFNIVPFLLWNYVVAPLFSWPHVGFFKLFFIIWAINVARNLIFGVRK
jgi:hypothetical protein